MNRTLIRIGALAGAATLATVTAAPGYAATISQASAAAITIDMAGRGEEDSGRVTVTNDGSGQQKTGTSEPAAPIPTEGAFSFGVLAQDAEARVVEGQGRSAACAGVAGDGGSVIQLGESTCLEPGEDVDLSLGTLDLPDELGPGQEQVETLVQQALGQVGDADEGSEESPVDREDLKSELSGEGSRTGRGDGETQDRGRGDADSGNKLEKSLPSEAPGSGTQPSSTQSRAPRRRTRATSPRPRPRRSSRRRSRRPSMTRWRSSTATSVTSASRARSARSRRCARPAPA